MGDESRGIIERERTQGSDESIIYTVDVSGVGTSPTDTSAKIYSISGETKTDVTATCMPAGATSVNGNVITLPAVTALTPGTIYRVEVKFTANSRTCLAHFYITAVLDGT